MTGYSRNNPVALPFFLAVTSSVIAASNWDAIPATLPLWWSAYAHPILWAPKWLGLAAFPLLQLLIPYLMYQKASRDPKLQQQSGESAYAVANIIALPAILLFMVFALVFIPSVLSSSQDFLPRIFTSNIAIWALFWLGYNFQFVEPNSSVGVPMFSSNSHEELWDEIHTRAGLLLMLLGVVLFVFALSCPIGIPYFVMSIVIWIGAYVSAIVYSYVSSKIVKAVAEDDSTKGPLLESVAVREKF